MGREARKKLRIAISVVHIFFQVIFLWLLFDTGADLKVSSTEVEISALYQMLSLFTRSVILFAVQYSLMKMFAESHHVHMK